MTETRMTGVLLAEAAPAQQRSHVWRESWERSWLMQQRAASAVIASPAAPGPTINAQMRASITVSEAAVPVRMSPSNLSYSRLPQDRAPPPQQTEAQPAGAATELHRSLNSSNAGSMATPVPRLCEPRAPRTAFVPCRDTYAAGQPRMQLPNCAFWRTEGAIAGAMRLRDPVHQAARILQQLRTWLHEGGLQLRKLLINGRVGWETAPTSTTVHQSSPPVARHPRIEE